MKLFHRFLITKPSTGSLLHLLVSVIKGGKEMHVRKFKFFSNGKFGDQHENSSLMFLPVIDNRRPQELDIESLSSCLLGS